MNLADTLRAADAAIETGDSDALSRCLDPRTLGHSHVELARGLLGLLRDEEDLHHEMFAIIHAIERLDPKHVYEAVAMSLPSLRARTKEWSEVVVGRLLAARNDQGRGFDYRAFVSTLRERASGSTLAALDEVMDALEAGENAGAPTRQGIMAARAIRRG